MIREVPSRFSQDSSIDGHRVRFFPLFTRDSGAPQFANQGNFPCAGIPLCTEPGDQRIVADPSYRSEDNRRYSQHEDDTGPHDQDRRPCHR